MKKRYLFLIMIICLFAVSAVSGAEIGNDTNMVANSDDSGLIAESVNENILTDSYGTFGQLKDEIDAVGEGGTLNLTRNYKYVNGSTDGISINKPITIDGNGYTLDSNQFSRIFIVNAENVILKNISFINGYSDNGGGAVYWKGSNGILSDCIFVNCSSFTPIYGATSVGGAIYFYYSTNSTLSSCSFVNCSSGAGGAIFSMGYNITLNTCSFVNCSTFTSKYDAVSLGGAVNFDGNGGNNVLSDCIFVNCSSFDFIYNYSQGGAVYWGSNYGHVSGCCFVNCSSRTEGGAVYWTAAAGVLDNCSFYNNFADTGNAICWYGMDGIINSSYFSPHLNSIHEGASDLIIIKLYSSSLSCENISFKYKDNVTLSAYLNTYGGIIFNISNEYCSKMFVVDTTNEGIATLNKELSDLTTGTWNVTAIFEGNDNYYPCNTTATITVLPPSTSLTIGDSNGTVGHETTLIANVISNLTINEGTVTFFDGKTNIGKANVVDGKASITYTPTTAGEHTITAIFNSDNYLSSNDTSRLLVDSATVDVLVDSGVVGFNSNFVANVKGLYSTVNEGNVKFYVGKEYLGKVPVVNGSASTNYVPLIAGDYTVNVIYCDSDKFLDDEDSTGYHVSKADTKTLVNDLNGTVGHGVSITSIVSSSNKLTVNEGSVVFFDGKNQIGESQVTNGKASITYTPTTAGEHTITAIFNSDNYLSSNDTSVLSVKKANIDLAIADIAPVLFTNPSNFAVNVNSNYKAVNEGRIKYYVNNDLVGTVNVNDGVANLDYATNTAGSFTLVAVYDETSNYLASNTTATFIVNKMPTVLSAESVIFDEKGDKIFTTDLKDDNTIGVSGQNVKIETIKYSGESKTFNGITDTNGIAEYNVNNLEGGMWFVTGTYDGNGNYINSKFSDKFIVIRMDTTTNIEEIDNPQVNHTYKLKANIHDENGKLVKEGIVQFYLDGVDIGSIDLSKHELKSNNDLLGAFNPIFDYKLGVEDEEPYLEYTPTKSGNFKLSAVYEGTTIYKTSNYTTDFIVSEGNEYNLSAPDVVKYYHGPERFVVTVKDRQNNPVVDGEVTITLNGVPYNRTTDANGQASMAINLISGVHQVTSEFGDIKVQSTVTVKPTISGNNVTKIYRNDTQYYATFKDSNGNLLRNTDVNFNINGVFYTRKTNDAGVARMNINLLPGEYIITAYNPSSTEQSGNLIKVLPSIITYDLTKYYKNASALTFRLLNNQGRPVGAGVSATININGVFYTRQTNASGYVNMNINLIPGTYIATLNYNGLMASSTVKILPILEAKDVVMKYRDGTKFEAKLLDGQGKPFANQTLIFNINGVMYNRITDGSGIARLNINLMPGEYIITSMYENGATIANKVTIRS